MEPQIDIELMASPFCLLNREEKFSIYMKYRFHYREPITIETLSSIFDLAATFANNRIEILDPDTQGAVVFENLSRDKIQVKQDESLILQPELERYWHWKMSTQQSSWHEYPFDISRLYPDRKYTVTYRNHGISQWYHGSYHSLHDIPKDIEVQPGESIQVNLIGNTRPQFTSRESLRPPPPVTASLSTSAPICATSGDPPFTVSLIWRLHSSRPIYALVLREEGRNFGLEIRDPERNGRRVGPPPNVLQGDMDDAISNDEEIYVALNGLEDGFSEDYTLDTKERQGGRLPTDTRNLKSGKEYHVTLRENHWRWLYQDEVQENFRSDEAKLIEVLKEEPHSKWKSDSRVTFHAD